MHLANTVLWIYIVLLLMGGLVGYLKAKSRISLVTSAFFAAALILTAIPGLFAAAFAKGFANLLLAALIIIFALRLAKTKKFMPTGLMLAATIVVLALRNIKL